MTDYDRCGQKNKNKKHCSKMSTALQGLWLTERDVAGGHSRGGGAGTIFQQGGQAWCVTQPFPAGGLGAVRPQAGPGAEPWRQTHFGNNLLKIYLKSGLWFAVYTPNSDPISDVHWLVRQ